MLDGLPGYEAVRGALAADDAVEREVGEPKFKVRDTPDWNKHAADLEAEMLKRGMNFSVSNGTRAKRSFRSIGQAGRVRRQ
ncbi:hypothetical protein [Bradyrhizobium sp. JYMT SZCCT0180]|uniref:hypothetical protein n=1 Tax=Bradyrhizobium sp. JYMT SZCCT0180 TaxID=2807666 RepID=UPI001BA97ED1|nr:hypothetical protein [Bradyrhizobium sp. JYMT SZCCT0180]MBR1213967.1 hypothetical protein [Bradyrhizobium sp. JYMT SZCCT0180]